MERFDLTTSTGTIIAKDIIGNNLQITLIDNVKKINLTYVTGICDYEQYEIGTTVDISYFINGSKDESGKISGKFTFEIKPQVKEEIQVLK